MDGKQLLFLGVSAVASAFGGAADAADHPGQQPYVRVADIEIDPSQLDAYKAALLEEVESSVRLEPGVLALYAVADKDNPAHATVFEIYADVVAYQAHLQTPHFRTYKEATQDMVRSLRLRETLPIALASKAR